ncbi:MAG: CARDB domain-containing protein [Pseudomonadota bacterium]
MNVSIARRIACFSMLTLNVAMAHAAGISANPPVLTRASAPVGSTATIAVTTPPVLQMSPPDLAMLSLTPSKTTVNRMEPFTLTYHVKNVSNKPVANARVRVTADYYPLNTYVTVGALAAGQEKTGTMDITVMKDSMMNMAPEPYVVHIKFKGAAQIVGANNGAVSDLNPGNDEKTTVTVNANPG